LFRENKNFIILMIRMELSNLGIGLIILGASFISLAPFLQATWLSYLGLIAAETVVGLSIFFFYYLVTGRREVTPAELVKSDNERFDWFE